MTREYNHNSKLKLLVGETVSHPVAKGGVVCDKRQLVYAEVLEVLGWSDDNLQRVKLSDNPEVTWSVGWLRLEDDEFTRWVKQTKRAAKEKKRRKN